MKAIMIEFTIAAAKGYEDDEPNWKYIDTASTCAEAMRKFSDCTGYPIIDFHIQTTWDSGAITRVPVFGGPEEKLTNEGRWVRTDQAPELDHILERECARANYTVRLRRLLDNWFSKEVPLVPSDLDIAHFVDRGEYVFRFKHEEAAEVFASILIDAGAMILGHTQVVVEGEVRFCVTALEKNLKNLRGLDMVPHPLTVKDRITN